VSPYRFQKLVKTIRLILESFGFALGALKGNLMRTVLSLLGVTVGIFAIIAVFTIVDSLERSLKESFSFLGERVINVEKWPYGFEGEYPWWKYLNRPQTSHKEYQFLSENLSSHSAITISARRSNVQLKKENNSFGGALLMGVAANYNKVYEVPIEQGRYFSRQEIQNGKSVVIIGHVVARQLFSNSPAIGGRMKIKGMNFIVIGVMREEGESFIGIVSNDENCLIPFEQFKKLYYTRGTYGIGSTIAVKGREDDQDLQRVEGEIKGLMRTIRGLKPKQEENFALNRPEAIARAIGSTFNVIGIAGWVIGSFSILVGGFGIANIMFVSVKERTPIIGIQKSLGAKNYFILMEFLFEAVFLSLFGGSLGMTMVYGLTFFSLGDLELDLTFGNLATGLGVSVLVGVASGIIPAWMASRMDPVVAIRSK